MMLNRLVKYRNAIDILYCTAEPSDLRERKQFLYEWEVAGEVRTALLPHMETCLKAKWMKEWLLSYMHSKTMKTRQELQQTRTSIVEAPECLFENHVNRLVVCLIDASNDYIMSHFKVSRSVVAGYEHHVDCFMFYSRYARLTGLKHFAEANRMGNCSVLMQLYTQRLKEMVQSCAQCTTGSNVENKSTLYDDSFDIFVSTLHLREEQVISAGAELSWYPIFTLLYEERTFVLEWLNEQKVVCPDGVSVSMFILSIPECKAENERIFFNSGTFSRHRSSRMSVERLKKVLNIYPIISDRSSHENRH